MTVKYIGSVFFSLFFLTLVSINVSASEQHIPNDQIEKSTAAMFSEEKEFSNKELIIKFHYSVSSLEKKKFLQSNNLVEKDYLKIGNLSLVSVPNGTDLETLAKELLENKIIEHVEPNYQVESTFSPSDAGYKKQWYLKRISAPKAWDDTKGSSKVKVAVIDGGVQKDHPELKNKIVDPFNMVNNSTSYTPDEHGTHVAGIIAAANNRSGTVGVAPNVSIMPINVFSGSRANMMTIVKAISYAVDHKADVINMSLVSYSYSSILEEAVNYAKANGITVIAAAGNDDTYLKPYPASFDSVIAVSATDSYDEITYFSNYGSYIDISAPGENIYSTVPYKRYAAMDGTSMASPVVSGVAALVLSKNPFLSPAKVKDILKKSTADLGRNGWDSLYGYGRIDAYKAVKNTTPAVKDIKTASTFTMKGTNKHAISFTPQSGTTVTVYVRNSKGEAVRKLTSAKSSGKKMTSYWDGKLDTGAYASNGTYSMVVRLTTSKKSYYKIKTVKVENQVNPSISLYETNGEFSPNVKNLSIPFKLNENARISVRVYDQNGKYVRTLWSGKSFYGGKKYYAQWDGKNNVGRTLVDGNYRVQFTIIDSSKRKGTAKYFNVQMDTVPPSDNTLTGVQSFIIDGTMKKVGDLTFNENVTANAYITTTSGTKVKKLLNNKALSPSTYEITWDGTNDQKSYVDVGSYQLLVELRDRAGNLTTIQSESFNVEDWTKPEVKSTAQIVYNLQGTLSVPYSISKTGNVKVEIKKGESVIYSHNENTQTKGSHSFTWNGKDNSGNQVTKGTYSFSITIQDAHGTGNFVGEIQIN